MPEFAWVEQNYGLGWWYAHLLSCRRRWSEVFERLDALARGMADVHTEGITSHLYAGQTMACVLAERLAIRDLLAHPELQPLIVPNEDYGDAAQQTHPPAADHVGESEVGRSSLSFACRSGVDRCTLPGRIGLERGAPSTLPGRPGAVYCSMRRQVGKRLREERRTKIHSPASAIASKSQQAAPPQWKPLCDCGRGSQARPIPPERPHRQQENWDCESMFPLDHCALRRVLDEPRGRNEASYPPKREGGARTVYR